MSPSCRRRRRPGGMLVNSGWQGNPRIKALCRGEALQPDLADRLAETCARGVEYLRDRGNHLRGNGRAGS